MDRCPECGGLAKRFKKILSEEEGYIHACISCEVAWEENKNE